MCSSCLPHYTRTHVYSISYLWSRCKPHKSPQTGLHRTAYRAPDISQWSELWSSLHTSRHRGASAPHTHRYSAPHPSDILTPCQSSGAGRSPPRLHIWPYLATAYDEGLFPSIGRGESPPPYHSLCSCVMWRSHIPKTSPPASAITPKATCNLHRANIEPPSTNNVQTSLKS